MMIVTKFLRSCCRQATVVGKFIEGQAPLASFDGWPEHGRAISLDDIGGIESRALLSFGRKHGGTINKTSRVHRAARRYREDWRQAHHARGTERKTSDPHSSQR